MASQRHHDFDPNEVSSTGARCRKNENVVNFILQTYPAAWHSLDEPALMLLKAAILALLDWWSSLLAEHDRWSRKAQSASSAEP
jgi:hypothetical protein